MPRGRHPGLVRRTTCAIVGSRCSTLRGVPWARIGEQVGQRNLAVTANTYSHVLMDESEIDYATLVASKPSQA